jgi:hypothetical protein
MDAVQTRREDLVFKLRTVREGAAQISRLLVDGILSGDDWDNAARILTGCRLERRRLEDQLRTIDM